MLPFSPSQITYQSPASRACRDNHRHAVSQSARAIKSAKLQYNTEDEIDRATELVAALARLQRQHSPRQN